jgi:hypothetical protein
MLDTHHSIELLARSDDPHGATSCCRLGSTRAHVAVILWTSNVLVLPQELYGQARVCSFTMLNVYEYDSMAQ